jgi:formate dehydrogenase iron-sulfur subunit
VDLQGNTSATNPPDVRRSRTEEFLQRAIGPFLPVVSPPPRTPTGFFTDTTVCIGCKACEVACKQWNELPADGLELSGNSYDNTGELSATSWRHVKFIEQFPAAAPSDAAPAGNLDAGRWLMMSDVCKHCAAAPCQQACPTGAIIYNEFNNVYIQPEICNGCAYCIAACPFGVITRSMFDGHAHKCTLCYDRQQNGLVPACAKACPTASIQFGPVEELRKRAGGRLRQLHEEGVGGAHLYGDGPSATYSSLNSFYLLVDRPSVYGLPEKPFDPWNRMKGDYVRAIMGGLAGVAIVLAMFLLQGR